MGSMKYRFTIVKRRMPACPGEIFVLMGKGKIDSSKNSTKAEFSLRFAQRDFNHRREWL